MYDTATQKKIIERGARAMVGDGDAYPLEVFIYRWGYTEYERRLIHNYNFFFSI